MKSEDRGEVKEFSFRLLTSNLQLLLFGIVPLSGVTNATPIACYMCQARLPRSKPGGLGNSNFQKINFQTFGNLKVWNLEITNLVGFEGVEGQLGDRDEVVTRHP